MAQPVVVVTDSTASLPPAIVREAGIVVVPLHVLLDGADLADDEPARAAVAARLRAGGTATTSLAPPESFTRVYAELAASGATGIVSVHLSAELSGTAGAAREAATGAPVPVTVVDSGSVALGTGFAVLAAARRAAQGGGLGEVSDVARDTAAAAAVYFAVQDLAYLRRGGRINAAQALVGSVLGARPILHMDDGRIGVAETVRGAARASRRLVELAVDAARTLPSAPVAAAVHHFDSEEVGRELAEHLGGALREAGFELSSDPPLVAEVTAVVGVHTGPGVLGVVVAPAPHTLA